MHTYVLQHLVSSRHADLQRDRHSIGSGRPSLLHRLRFTR